MLLDLYLARSARLRLCSALKAEVVIEAIKDIKTIAEIAQDYELHPVQVTKWRRTSWIDPEKFLIVTRKNLWNSIVIRLSAMSCSPP